MELIYELLVALLFVEYILIYSILFHFYLAKQIQM